MNHNTRIHRVGSVTAGVSMIAFGCLFLLHLFSDMISCEMIFRFWPVMIIGLGIEVLVSTAASEKYVYDAGAVVLMIIMSFLACAMAGADLIMRHGIF